MNNTAIGTSQGWRRATQLESNSGRARQPSLLIHAIALLALVAVVGVTPVYAQVIEVGDKIKNPGTGDSLTVTWIPDQPVILNGPLILPSTAVGTTFTDPNDAAKTVTIASVKTNPVSKVVDQLTVEGDRFDVFRSAGKYALLTGGNSVSLHGTSVGDTFTDPADATKTVTIAAVHTEPVTGLVDQVIVAGNRSFDVFSHGTSYAVPTDPGAVLTGTSAGVTFKDPNDPTKTLTIASVHTDPGSGRVDQLTSEGPRFKVFRIGNTDAVLTDRNSVFLDDTEVGDTFKDPADATKTLTITSVRVDPATSRVDQVTVGDGRSFDVNRVRDDDALFADGNLLILTNPMVGATFPDPADPSKILTVVSVRINPTTGLVDQMTFDNGSVSAVVKDISDQLPGNPNVGTPPGPLPIPLPPGAGNSNFVHNNQQGANGRSGRAGAGIRICIPFLGCHTIGVNPTNGDGGGNGPTINQTVSSSHGAISTVSDRVPGISVASVGGNGGDGGNGWGNLRGGAGGAAGAGGSATATSDVDIVTRGAVAYGFQVQSRSGNGGQGGTGFIFGPGGSGGAAGSGGPATGTNNGNITTYGTGSIGLFVQSLGGAAGGGGDSFGLVGQAGNALTGGNGGFASATNNGTIFTFGTAAHGVFAQSIGGSGGDAGNAAGIVAFGDKGSAGGNGGSAVASNNGRIFTEGAGAIGLFAQSIGGGGGNGGWSGGVVAFGSEGAAGGNGGNASAFNGRGAVISTKGTDAFGIFAQSVGGGGGNGGVGGGIVAFGGSGSGGGHGGNVTITTAPGGFITTSGRGAYGLFGQSIGGGGGSGASAGGIVALGGHGDAAANGGAVTITNDASVGTTGVDARGIFAQSVGGGGGNASGSGGVVSVGGAGGSGGAGGAVTVTNGGTVATTGLGADAIFGQSIGGGGGSGASSVGVVSIGGKGTTGGSGGLVTVTNTGAVSTESDRSRGVFAESVGGGGGTGGDSLGLVSLGAAGGVASTGGPVTVTNDGTISTAGNVSSAIEAQSIGGGGGDGGTSGGVFFSLGGTGGGGGNAGPVTVNQGRILETQGNDSHGIFAQSVGGGGGNGGNSGSLSLFAGVAIGGKGGGAGNGSSVTVALSDFTVDFGGGTITLPAESKTSGDRSKGIFAQSVGGGGGNGGFAVQTSIGYGPTASVALGGNAGGGGAGGAVTLTGDATILTDGKDSDGVLLQSVGGGGGNAGLAASFAGAAHEAGAAAFALAIGGSGGNGGAGGHVVVDSGGFIGTTGNQAEGLIAQSIGGGGGNGGFSVALSAAVAGGAAGAVSVGVGGSGGSGGDAGRVDVGFGGDVATDGHDAGAILLQAVGGGGGNGGFDVSGAVALALGGSSSTSIGVGGRGGSGGAGGVATGNITGDLTTQGDRSVGLMVQSVGGGGGNAGLNLVGSVGAALAVSGGASLGVGGSGGGGGAASTADGTLTGVATTHGVDADAVLVQSVGGGGGNGGVNVSGVVALDLAANAGIAIGVGGAGGNGGAGGIARGNVEGSLATDGDRSAGLVVQSVGGGGGNSGLNLTSGMTAALVASAGTVVGVGSSGGGGGLASEARARLAGDASTRGMDAAAVLVQSVGGGGGNGGVNATGFVTLDLVANGGTALGVGSAGGGGGNGGVARATVDGHLTTDGDRSDGFIVQSVGGGGGNGGLNLTAGLSASLVASGSSAAGVGGSGGSGGAASLVEATLTGTASTRGVDAAAVLLQSVGGGGGNGGINATGSATLGLGSKSGSVLGVGGAGGGGGAGGVVLGAATGDVVTLGDRSNGFIAQSVGGGGGNGGFNVPGALSAAGDQSGSAAVGIGGAGGGGGSASTVNGQLNGTATTFGTDANAVLIQSVGGGGGSGGFNVGGAISVSAKGSGARAQGVGGAGGGGGAGGTVIGAVTGDLVTFGDRSNGLVVQSVGGGGGSGGFNVAGTISAAGDSSGSTSVGVGGAGGGGGSASTVNATLSGTATTQGADAKAVLAQSVGGGGGNGAFNIAGAIAGGSGTSGTVSVGVGGAGGNGGKGGDTNLSVDGGVATSGERADGVVAQSIGGGGGDGGFSVSSGISVSSGAGSALAVGVGGSGGVGGAAGEVAAHITGTVTTEGKNARAVLVQSVGGGGGNGGFNVAGTITASNAGVNSVAVGVGGVGGGGGAGGLAHATIDADVATSNDGSSAVLIQSVGGGGGNGGFDVTGGIALSKSASGAMSLGVGGSGGGGGNAGDVSGTVSGTVRTSGADSLGVLAQSIGGGGGNGGLNVTGGIGVSQGTASASSIGVGGSGGGGGNSANVTFLRDGTTETSGANSTALTVQSIAGGGGNGGVNVSGAITYSQTGSSASSAIGVGGFGGVGGNSGNVAAIVAGDVIAAGLGSDTVKEVDGILRRLRTDGSNGVLVQSVGGGGGNGGINVSGGIALGQLGSSTAYGTTFGVGGFGGGGGDAGTVALSVRTDTVSAVGDQRAAIIAQSVGGGGGNGGLDVAGGIVMGGALTTGVGGFGGGGGVGGSVTATVVTDVSAAGSGSRGLIAQSVGGGGGNGGINISGGISGVTQTTASSIVYGLGGLGGPGNKSGNVSVTQAGQVAVEGIDSIGVVVQSIAGGGGSGGLNVSGNLSGTDGFATVVGIGGSGGRGADAGDVRLVSDGAVTVDGRAAAAPDHRQGDGALTNFGERANGILAQSVGGGGGNAGLNVSGVGVTGTGSPIAVSVGGSGSGGGNAGSVTVERGTNNSALIETFGNQANGLTAQSVGGGGGQAGMNFALAASLPSSANPQQREQSIVVGGTGGDPGHGGTTTVIHVGDIVTQGNQSDGLLAQSVGGGGGNANINIAGADGLNASSLTLAVGGAPGDGGNGGFVGVEHTGVISTRGDDSSALVAQSVGGGGGDTSLNMTVVPGSSNALDLTIGRRGGTGGTGGDVSVRSTGDLNTIGARAVGLLAQSVGNGGGVSNTGSSETTPNSAAGTAATSTSVKLSVGLEGGAGGRAGSVDVDASGFIETKGAGAQAIFAQSVGGGGGIGGAVTSLVFKDTAASHLGIGGIGGTGGLAGAVHVANHASVVTEGEKAAGIQAQSIGGGGGTGGLSGLLSLQAGDPANGHNSFGVDVGGAGGIGADGGVVAVENTGSIVTKGSNSAGVGAQSVGGGGGDGGIVLKGSLAAAGHTTSLDLGVGGATGTGGAGGIGGVGGNVFVTNKGRILTIEEESPGVRAQSIGGGGGNAGLVATLEIATGASGPSSQVVTMNVGGVGGTGGVGGNVTVDNQSNALIQTQGLMAYGIQAQSIGGGGGDGSSVVSGTFAIGSNTGSNDVTLIGSNIGGKGGDGASSGRVTVTNGGRIETLGRRAHGVFAQSIAGGGGNGGISLAASGVISSGGTTPMVVLGGSGGKGANAGDVAVSNSGQIVTHGIDANGVYAQSVGGGGGNAGVGLALSNDIANMLIANLMSFFMGGTGGQGGLGGKVTVNQTGNISVFGRGAQAIKAESINGGGGHVVLDFSGIASLGSGVVPGIGPQLFAAATPTQPAISIRAGGQEQVNTDAGAMSVSSTGTFLAAGNNGAGVGSQSIGGGGGTVSLDLGLVRTGNPTDGRLSLDLALGGIDGTHNSGSAIESTHIGDIVTTGADSHGVALQSIGGGGGRGSFSVTGDGALGPVTLGLGGTAGTTEMGGAVTHRQTGSVTTFGDGSHGVLIESLGGGGGSANLGIAAGIAGQDPAKVTLGALGGSHLDGGRVSATLVGDVTTAGAGALGLVAQSIGAGGGEARLTGNHGLDVTLGGSAGAAGDGGSIEIAHTGSIATTGDRAHALFLQSIGGGGGAVFADNTSVLLYASAANTGNGGAIDVVQTGNITTTGAGSFGMFVQSLGGGGGYVDGIGSLSAGGRGAGGAVSVALNGSVTATADDATAVYLQSAGVDGAGNINLALPNGYRIVGGARGTAVAFGGGADNLFTNRGLVTSTSGVLGFAIRGTTGNDRVMNYGQLDGSVDLGSGANTLVNTSGALFNSGAIVSVGAGNVFANAGTLSPGGFGRIQTTAVTGHFAQAGAPIWFVDIGEVGDSDRFTVSGLGQFGNSITTVNLHQMFTPAGAGAYTLVSAAGGLSGAQFKFGSMDGAMPIGKTFSFLNSDTAEQLTLLPSTGRFVWAGALNTNLWNSPFVNGKSNWSRGPADTFIFGTPGADSDVIFPGIGSSTALGADFTINSLEVTSSESSNANRSVVISGSETLTLAAHDGLGITVDAGAPNTTIAVPLILGADQSWINNSSSLLSMNGPRITGAGRSLTFDGTGNALINAPIQTGSGGITKAGSGRVVLTGANSYTGATTVAGGTLEAGAVNVFGVNSATTVAGGARLDLDSFNQALGSLAGAGDVTLGSAVLTTGGNDTSTTYAGTMSGSGGMVKAGAGTFTLSGPNTYSGGTLVSAGTLQGNATSLQGFIINNAAVVFDQIGTGTYAGNMSGTGSLFKQNSGLLALAGTSSYSGGTTVSGGTLQGNTASLQGNILNNATVVFDQAFSGTYDGSISGSGALFKQNSGVLVFNGSHTYAGPTTVAGGQLFVNGSIGGNFVRVQSGAVLGGNGFVPTVTVDGGGTLAPGTLRVNGDVHFDAGSFYRVGATSEGLSSLTLATGSVTGLGGVVTTQSGGIRGYHPITTYTIFRAPNVVAGSFSGAAADLPYLNASLQYDPTTVYLTLRRNDVDFRSTGTTGNQTAVASSLNRLVSTATGEMAGVINNVYDLTNQQALHAMGSMTGVAYQHVGQSTIASTQAFMDMNITRVGQVASGAGEAVTKTEGPVGDVPPGSMKNRGVWFSGLGGVTRYSGNDIDQGARIPTRGMVVGYDAAVRDAFILGVSGSESSPEVQVEDGSSQTTSRLLHLALYGHYEHNASRLGVVFGLGDWTNNTTRAVTDGFTSSKAKAAYGGWGAFSQIEYGHLFNLGTTVEIEPQVGLQFTRVAVDGFTEEGAGVLNLVAPERRISSQRTNAGFRVRKTIRSGSAVPLTIEGRAAWAHELSPLASVTMRFVGDTATSGFDLASPYRARNNAVLGASLVGHGSKHLQFFASVGGDVSGAINGWTGDGGIRAGW